MPAEEVVAPRQSTFKVAITAMACASIEWYDFFIYATAAALIFPTAFFPATLSPLVSQLASFSTFAVGFVARPLGGVLFGHFGDLHGRKAALVCALLMMGVATTALGLLPTYATAGALAPVLLTLLRFVQGLAVGGQWGGAALLAIESAPIGKRGYYGSFAQVGVPAGVLLANIVFLVVNASVAPGALEAWAWRIPFLLSVSLIFLALYVQLKLEDSAEFKAIAERKGGDVGPPSSPMIAALRTYPGTIALAGLAFVASNGCFYLIITYAMSYGIAVLHLPRSTMLLGVMAGSLCMAPALLYFAALSDRIGRKGLFMAGAACTGVFAFGFFPMIETGSTVVIALAMILGLIFVSMMYGPQAALFADLFDPEIRYSGASISYQIGAVFGGGFAPIIATALYAVSGSSLAISGYMSAMAVLSLICTAALTLRATPSGLRIASGG